MEGPDRERLREWLTPDGHETPDARVDDSPSLLGILGFVVLVLVVVRVVLALF